MRNTLLFLALLAASCLIPPRARAQPQLKNLPSAASSARFFTDQTVVIHPSLSINGFDCAVGDNTCDHGLGLKQILEKVYGDSADSSVIDSYNRVLDAASDPLQTKVSSRSDILVNVNRLQARAFAALATFILEQNDISSTSMSGASSAAIPPSHQEVREQLLEAARSPDLFQIDSKLNGDGIKWTSVVTSYARAVDLYLALEIARVHYEPPEPAPLLTCDEKRAFLNGFGTSLQTLEAMGSDPVPELMGLNLYQVQSGNWPLRLQVALGYASLTLQADDGSSTCGSLAEITGADAWLPRAIESAGVLGSQNRSSHWSYQTDRGQRFWAEGPYYFHLILEEVVPFWHALRINGLLGSHPDGTIEDPFRSGWFLDPLRWMADLATPDGRTPALDDGNKQEIYNSHLLAWDASYGGEEVGETFAWINSRLPAERSYNMHTDLVAMAVPRVSTSKSRAPEPALYAGGQQLVLRRTAGPRRHYLLLNGEHGAAVQRGEGHEQGDPLQLLYEVGGISYLADSGYDSAEGVGNSTWNHYADHNVMLAGPGDFGSNDGGVLPPSVNVFCPCISSSQQWEVQDLGYLRSGRVDVLSGTVELVDAGGSAIAENRRTVLYIDDPEAPYVIDVNAARAIGSPSGDDHPIFEMRYHGNSPEVDEWIEDGYAVLWKNIYGNERDGAGVRVRTDNHLLVHPFSVEHPVKADITSDTARELYSPRGVDDSIKRLSIYSGPGGESLESTAARTHTTVAFLQALIGDPSPSPDYWPAVRSGRLPKNAAENEENEEGLMWQYFLRTAGDDRVDVFAVRAADAAASIDEAAV